jgi:hypothetical protein
MRIFAYLAVLLTIFQLADAQKTKRTKKSRYPFRPRRTRIRDCYLHENYYFCNHGDFSVKDPKPRRADTYGYCCPMKTTSKKCQQSDTIECTKKVKKPTDQGKPLYMTYWPGMTLKKCN